jgi:hypothetical protein
MQMGRGVAFSAMPNPALPAIYKILRAFTLEKVCDGLNLWPSQLAAILRLHPTR